MKTIFHDKTAAETFAAATPGAKLIETTLPLRHGDLMPAWEVRLPRSYKMPGCPLCESGESFNPPHFASPNCQSGGHNHCSCDTCF